MLHGSYRLAVCIVDFSSLLNNETSKHLHVVPKCFFFLLWNVKGNIYYKVQAAHLRTMKVDGLLN